MTRLSLHPRLIFLALVATAFAPVERAAESETGAQPGVSMNSINRLSLRAMLVPITEVKIPSRAAGVIEKYAAEEGQMMKAGDPILLLDSNQEKAEVDQATAILLGARAELERAKRDFDAVKPLRQEQIYSEKQLADAKYGVAIAESKVAQAEASLSAANVRLANRTVSSSIDGIFLKKSKNVGEAVDRFEVVARVVDASALEAVFFCDASLFERLKNMRAAKVQIQKADNHTITIEAQVSYVDPIIDVTGTFRLKVRLPASADAGAGYPVVLIIP